MSFLHDCNLIWKKSKEEAFIHHFHFAEQKRSAISYFELNEKVASPYRSMAKHDENLCWAIREVDREKLLKDRLARKHYEENDEMRTLLQKIRYSYTKRSNEEQIQENMIRRKSEKTRLNEDIAFINSCRNPSDLEELETKKQIREQLISNEEESKQQVCLMKQRKHDRILEEQRELKQYEEDLRETIAKEKAAERELKRTRARELDEYMKNREADLFLRKLEEEEYDRSIQRQVIIKDEEIKRRKEEKERALQRRADISQSIGIANLERETKRIQKRDELEALIVLERDTRIEAKEEELKVKQVEKVIRTKHLNDYYLNEKLKKVDEQRLKVAMEKYFQMKDLEKLKAELDGEKEEHSNLLKKFSAESLEKRQNEHINFALFQTQKQRSRADDLAALKRESVSFLFTTFF